MKKFYKLMYVIEARQQKRLSELAIRFHRVNGWTEKDMLQFAITATSQADLDMKFQFLEGIIADLEKEEQTQK